jgi:hypothetical protein
MYCVDLVKSVVVDWSFNTRMAYCTLHCAVAGLGASSGCNEGMISQLAVNVTEWIE